jgi:hypothetical protein|nr:MAG TPA: tail protein [Caudoviricetes sp.]
MDGNKIMKSLGGLEVYDEACRQRVVGITSAGTGAAYTATVKAIEVLSVGANFVMVPHVTSTTTAPTLNVNGLGAKNIRMRISSSPKSTIQLPSEDFLTNGKPVRLIYDGQYWIVDDMVQPNANGLYGTVPMTSGGTGGTTVAEARKNLGLGETDGALPIENGGTGCTTLAAAKKLFSVADDTGVIPVSSGGTGAKTADDARTKLGITPANIGAATSSHKHSVNDITSGTLPISHGGTGASDAATARTNLEITLNNLGITWGSEPAESKGKSNTIYIQIN